MALPLYGAQLVLARWFTAHSRTALTSELYRLVVLLQLVGAVLATLLGRPLPFRVTPKALASGRQSNPEPRLLLPLLALLSLQLVALLNLLPIASGVRLNLLPESKATLALGVGWALVNVLLLLATLRCCWDRPRSDAVPWLAWQEAVQLAGQPAQLVAMSEAGLELELERAPAERNAAAPRLGQDLELTASDGRHWSLRLEACRGRRLGCSWAPIAAELEDERKEWLQQRLYRRDGQWPTRRAPAEPLALAVILTRLLRPLTAETWLERSLLPANPPDEQHGAVMAEMQR
jgi:cellulose synthase (UDP-forming)